MTQAQRISFPKKSYCHRLQLKNIYLVKHNPLEYSMHELLNYRIGSKAIILPLLLIKMQKERILY